MTARDPEMQAFVEDARRVDMLTAFSLAGGAASSLRRQGHEHVGPCPVHGGRRDRLQINPAEGVFLCRGSDSGGDAIALYLHLSGAEFLEACEVLVGRDHPGRARSENSREREQRRAAAEERLERQKAETAERESRMRRAETEFRAREWARCIDDWREAAPLPGTPAADYLAARGLPAPETAYVRCHPALGYFHDKRRIHIGPAMLVLFVVPAGDRWRPIGLHRTWVAPDCPPKFRPDIADPATGELLVTKKMRGSKAGGLLPIAGRYSQARRFVCGEGIETVLGFAAREGVQDDTFYCAAGDLGNLAGRAKPASRVKDTSRDHRDRAGRRRAVFVPGADPDFDSAAVPIPDHADDVVLLGDGDSDPVFTRLAMKRAARRHERPGRKIATLIAPAGSDWAEMVRFQDAVA